MLTPKRNGPGGDFFSDAAPRGTDEPVGASRRKPLSQILREERERKNISLQEVAKLTHIPLNYLQLLEGAEDERVVPDSMYLIASLRSYAAFLDIDQGTVLTQFIAELDQGRPAEERAGNAARPTRSRTRFSPQWPRALPRTLILLLPLGMLAIIGYYSELIQGPRLTEDKVAPLPAPYDSPPLPQSELPPPVASSSPSTSPPDGDQSQSSSSLPVMPPPVAAVPQTEPPSVSPPRVEAPAEHSPPQPQQPLSTSPHLLRVQAKAKTWVHVTLDGHSLKRVLLQPGQAVEWSVEKGFTLSLGNAAAVKLTLDGQELPLGGKAGQMVMSMGLPFPRGSQGEVRNAEHPPATKPH